jgi:Zn-dependent protease
VFGERSIQLMRVAGIRVGASPSWFIVLFLAIWFLSDNFQDALDGTSTEAYVTAVAAAVLFFVSIVLHEFGHAFAARRSGIQVEGIDLWFFGGIAKLSRDSKSPGEEFKVAAAGPAVTLLIVAVCLGISVLLEGSRAIDVATLSSDATTTPIELLVGFVGSMNAIIFVFNLVPAYPLDGGRIMRALAWKVTSDRSKGTVFAARLGQLFGYAMIGWGAYTYFTRDDSFGGIWWAVLGWLIASSARSAAVGAQVTERLEGVTVGDIMDSSPLTMPASTTLITAEEEWFGRHDAPWFAVVDETGRLLGIAERERVEEAVGAGRPALEVREILSPGEPVGTDQPLEAIIQNEPLRRLGAVMAVDGDGVLRGVLTVEQVRRALTAAVP